MTLSLSGMNSGGCVYARTPTAQYWLIMLGNLVAVVHRKGNNEEYAQRLEQRRMSNTITEGQPFTMFDINNQPISVIRVLECRIVEPNSVPLKRG